jgi:hypothetical protein
MANDATVDITTASRTLGLSVEALRKRLQRGAARGYKATDGTWRVFLDDPGANGNGTAGSVEPGGVSGLAAEVSSLKEEVRVLKTHLSDLRRALEETISGELAGPVLPSLASPRQPQSPVLEQPMTMDRDAHGEAPLAGASASPTFAPIAYGEAESEQDPWIGGGSGDFWPPVDEAPMAGNEHTNGAVPSRDGQDHAFSDLAADSQASMPDPFSDEILQSRIAETVDERLKPVLLILQEALLAMRKSR